MRGTCIRCTRPATHHHKYCDDHYPQKSATILALKTRLRKIEETLRNLLEYSINKKKYITKKELIKNLEKKGIKLE